RAAAARRCEGDLMILVIGEQRGGKLNRATWEAVAGAQQLAGTTGNQPIAILVIGSTLDTVAAELAAAPVQENVTIADSALDPSTTDGSAAALQQAIAQLSPPTIVLPHTYQTRDSAPKRAARLDRAIATDVTAVKRVGNDVAFVRPMFQGKLTADVVPEGPGPHFVTFQIGAFRADQAARGSAAAPIRKLAVPVDAGAIRQKPEAPFQEARQAVDLSQAERIVSVGRGIKEQSNIPLAQALADALGAELAASRPICDAGWLPMERQV